MQKEHGKWWKERMNERKKEKRKKRACQRWMEGEGRKREAPEGEGGLLKTGRSKRDCGERREK